MTEFHEGSLLNDYIVGEYKLSMWIPSDQAGRVVGKKGVVIKNIQREVNAQVLSAIPSRSDTLWTTIVAVGDWKCMNAAYKAISDIVSGEVDDVVLEYTINYKKHLPIFKKNNLTVLMHISAKTNVRIFVPDAPKEHTSFSNAQPMSLEGSFENVKKAVQLIEQEITSLKDKPMEAPRIVKREFPKEERAKPEETPASKPASQSKVNEQDSKPQTYPVSATSSNSEHISSKPDNAQGATPIASSNPVTVENKKDDPSANLPPAASKHLLTKVELAPSESASEKPLIITDKKTLEKHIDVPLNLVGLLLSRKPQLKVSILNQLQGMTYTIISKIYPNGGPASSSDKKNTDSDGEDEDVNKTSANNKGAEIEEGEFVPFKICGHNEVSINMAHDHLQRIIKGERIKEVIESLKIACKDLPKPPVIKDKPGPSAPPGKGPKPTKRPPDARGPPASKFEESAKSEVPKAEGSGKVESVNKSEPAPSANKGDDQNNKTKFSSRKDGPPSNKHNHNNRQHTKS